MKKKDIFNFENHILETVDSWKYLGLLFNYNAKFKQTTNDLRVRGTIAMFTVLCKTLSFNLPTDVQLEQFYVLVVTVILYGCEIWSSVGCDILSKNTPSFCKIILSLSCSVGTYVIPWESHGNSCHLRFFCSEFHADSKKIGCNFFRPP